MSQTPSCAGATTLNLLLQSVCPSAKGQNISRKYVGSDEV